MVSAYLGAIATLSIPNLSRKAASASERPIILPRPVLSIVDRRNYLGEATLTLEYLGVLVLQTRFGISQLRECIKLIAR